MDSKLVELDWNSDMALFPGSRSTVPADTSFPWCCLSEVVPGLFLTCEQELGNRAVALAHGMALIINLCAEEHVAPFKVYEYPEDANLPRYRKIESLSAFVDELDAYTKALAPFAMKNRRVYLRNIAAVDAPSYEIDRHFPETCALIELVMANRAKIAAAETDQSRIPSVGVHCMVGVSRSASVVLAYLMKTTEITRDDAISFVQTTRWVVNPNPGFQQQLLLWEATNHKRIFDEFSAELVANEVRKKSSVVVYVQTQLPIILKFNKCAGEREYFGYVVARGLGNSEAAADTVSAVYRELRSYITAAVDNEVYADTPNFFGYVAEVLHSVQRYAPELLFSASADGPEVGFVWSDVFYHRIVKDIGRSGFVKDTCDTVRAFCSLLEAVHVKQLTQAPLCLLSRPPEVSPSVPAPDCLALSFPFLPFMAPYAEGFVEFRDLNTLEEQFPAQGDTLSQEEVGALTSRVASLFLSAFLVSTTGACSPVTKPTDEENNEEASDSARTTSGVDSGARWGSTSRLFFLRPDVEVAVFEALSASKDPATLQADELVAMCGDCSQDIVARAAVRKTAAAVLAFRLLLETADRFVCDAYRDRLPAGAAVARHSETRFPLACVASLLSAVSSAYSTRFGEPCHLQQYFRAELDPLVQSEVMDTDGVWSILQVDRGI